MKEDERPDLATSIEVARRTGARYALLGTAVALGRDLRLTADVYDVTSGKSLGQAQVEGAPDSVYMLVDRLSIEALKTILGRPAEDLPRVELARVTTASLQALKAYLDECRRQFEDHYNDHVNNFDRLLGRENNAG